MNQKKIDRINELSRKQKSTGLTDDELKEQAALRQEYVKNVVGGLRNQLENASIKELDGTITPLKPKNK